MKENIIIFCLISLFIGSCNTVNKKETAVVETKEEVVKETSIQISGDSKSDSVVANAIKAHGGVLYDTADYTFIFRKKEYHFKNNKEQFTYEVKTNKNGKQIKDVLLNGQLTRYVNEEVVVLSEKEMAKYTEGLNSVIYFATLPHKLSDAAVNTSYEGRINIKEASYHVIKVFFDQEGGGTDHEDVYFYWINEETNKIDYLAYSYKVNGGGVRFRSYYNRRVVDGITFQDYINWGAHKNTSLATLPEMFEKGTLKEFSKIETEDVKSVK